MRFLLHQLISTSKSQADNGDENNDPDDTEEPVQLIAILARNVHVHAEKTTDQVHWNEDTGQEGNLAKHLINPVAHHDVCHVDLGKVVSVRTTEHLFKVAQTGHHGNNVILNIAKVKSDIAARCDRVLLVATLGESLYNVGFATQKAHETHNFLA